VRRQFGKVYNITPYLEYHPGGIGKLLVCKGRDATQLYGTCVRACVRAYRSRLTVFRVLAVKTHAWVNHEQLLDKCLVGMLVPGGDDDDGGGGGGEDRATGEEADGSTTSCSTTAADEQPEMEELTAEQEAELTMFPAREGQQVRK